MLYKIKQQTLFFGKFDNPIFCVIGKLSRGKNKLGPKVNTLIKITTNKYASTSKISTEKIIISYLWEFWYYQYSGY